GDAWHPTVTSTFLRDFHEHPPLAFWLESILFRIVGDHFWVERVYGLIIWLLTGTVLVNLWRHLLRDNARAAACAWLPIVLWIPCCYWSVRHNMLENTLTLFSTLSVYASLRAVGSSHRWLAWMALAGLAMLASFMTKGPVGLFPAATPAIAWVAIRRAPWPKAVLIQAGLLCCFAGSLGLLLTSEQAREYLGMYWQQQVLASMRGQRETVISGDGHFRILILMVRELAMPTVMACGVMLLARKQRVAEALRPALSGPRWFCLLTALSASLPIVVSPKQHGHYATPSWPFFSFALALWCLPAMLDLLPSLTWLARSRPQMLLRSIAGAVVGCTALIAVLGYGKCCRDQTVIEAVDRVAQYVGPDTVVQAPLGSWESLGIDNHLGLHAYLQRFHRISLFVDGPPPARPYAHFRLSPPDARLVRSRQKIVTDLGFDCRPLVPANVESVGGLPRTVR
ncbi:MAG TPA: glycosyltransferase family 39 protein, partial [Pirellulales bacterium]|nr:glycosyltransferase family 39 protein [Pirellulales bacterium]